MTTRLGSRNRMIPCLWILDEWVESYKHECMSNFDLFSLYEQFQSGFRPLHSTEPALVKITNDLLMAADAGQLTILILLDLSAAFDSISQTILIDPLVSLGISDTPLDWFKSYLCGRTQFVQLKKCRSHSSPLSSGVPQGSVLGPLLFIIYLLPLGLFSVNIIFSSIVMQMIPSSTCPPNPPRPSLQPPSPIASRKSDPGSPKTFSNSTVKKLKYSVLAPNPTSLK